MWLLLTCLAFVASRQQPDRLVGVCEAMTGATATWLSLELQPDNPLDCARGAVRLLFDSALFVRPTEESIMTRFALLATVLAFHSSCVSSGTALRQRPRLGMNLNGPADWNTELPFVDVFRLSRPWISQKAGAAVGQGAGAGAGRARLGQAARARLLGRDAAVHDRRRPLPGGKYTVLYDGQGKIDF